MAPRRSTKTKNPIDRFTTDKAHGYSSIKHYASTIIKCLLLFRASTNMYDMHYATALAMDPEFGILDGSSTLPPDFLNRNPTLFKSKSMPDPDTPNFKDALTGPFRDEFIKGMALEAL